jgi:hypothetical protein
MAKASENQVKESTTAMTKVATASPAVPIGDAELDPIGGGQPIHRK